MVDQQQETALQQEKISSLTPEHLALKTKFISKEIKPDDFFEGLFKLDQKDHNRTNADGNIELLEDKDILKLINSTEDPRLLYRALDDLAFFRFHKGQRLGMDGDVKAAQTLQKAFEEKQKARQFVESLAANPDNKKDKPQIESILTYDEPFAVYMEATAAYMSGQLQVVEKAYKTLKKIVPQGDPQSINTKIVGDFMTGLTKHKAPDYKRDYQPVKYSQPGKNDATSTK